MSKYVDMDRMRLNGKSDAHPIKHIKRCIERPALESLCRRMVKQLRGPLSYTEVESLLIEWEAYESNIQQQRVRSDKH